MKKALPIVVALLALSLYVYFARIRPGRIYDPTVRGSGTIEATEVVVAAKIPARVLEVRVAEGDPVTSGMVLVTLECSDLEMRKAQAEAQLAQARAALVQAQAGERAAQGQTAPLAVQNELAQKERDRAKALFDSESATQRAVDQTEAALKGNEEQMRAAVLAVQVAHSGIEVAAAQVSLAGKSVALANTQLEECSLKAPTSGVVLSRSREPGELVLPGASLLKIGKLDQVHTWIYVPNAEIGRVRVGAPVQLKADTYPDRTFDGTVTRINEEAEFTPKSIQTKEDRTRLVYGVKVSIPNAEGALLPGMPVEAVVLTETVPPAAAERAASAPTPPEAKGP